MSTTSTTQTNEDKKYAVIVATYKRRGGRTRSYLTRMFSSLQRQTFKQFKVYIIGDNYTDFNELKTIVTNSKLQVYIHNNPTSFRNGYFRIATNKWTCGGMKARYHGIKKAIEDGYKYYLHLDDDDYWAANHIREIDNCLKRYPLADFVYTKSRYGKGHMPNPGNVRLGYNNLIPQPAKTVHSTWCVNLQTVGPVFLKKFEERFIRINSMKRNPRTEVPLPPFDAILLKIINQKCRSRQWKSVYIGKVTCVKLTDVNVPK